jgi:NADH-quinone oxidoreductase subunit L
VIHGLGGEQELTRMGGLRRHMPITAATMGLGTLAIAGVPPLAGFFSKDEIVWSAFAGGNPQPTLGVVALVVAFMTAYYTGRLYCLAFLGTSRVPHAHAHHIHESPLVMTLPLVVLAVLSVVGGFFPVPAWVGAVLGHHEAPHAPIGMLVLASALAVGGLGLAWFLHVREPELPGVIAARLHGFYDLVRDKFRIDELYDALVVRPLFALSDALAWRVDQGVIDGAVNGAATLVAVTSGAWRRFQTGNVQHYALSFLAGALLLLGYWIAR